MRRSVAVALLLVGCFPGDRNLPPAPIGQSRGPQDSGLPPEVIGTTGTTGTSSGSSSTGFGSSTGGESSGGTSSAPTPEIFIAGTLEIGDGSWVLPMQCAVRFFLPGQLDTASGVATGWVAQAPVTIVAFPQPYEVRPEDFAAGVLPGTIGYVGARCDFAGHGVPLGDVGGFYPDRPAQLVTLPAAAIDIPIVFL